MPRFLQRFPLLHRFVLCTAITFASPACADTVLHVGGARINLHGDTSGLAATPAQIRNWVKNAALAVTTYYGRFPVPQVDVNLQAVSGRNVVTGTTYGYGTPHINIKIGAQAQAGALTDDWIMTHEMVHLAFPDVSERHNWIAEGIATYVEPLARAQAGQLPAKRVWGELVQGLPKGLPRRGDHGLDNTHTWGRTYWGGALFCLLADIQIRERTHNRLGLQDALRAIVHAGGNLSVHWSLQHALAVGDKAVGVPVLTELYAQMRDQPVTPDLDNLWRQLGVRSNLLGVRLNDKAPLAATRIAITNCTAAD